MRSSLALFALAVACHHDDPRPVAKTGSAETVAPPSYATWPPSPAERHARAEKLCPTVTPYFFELTKDGKTSHILGSRHIGVPFAKMPQVVHDDLHAAKLAVFEIAPDDKGSFDAPDEPLRDELGSADWAHFTDLVGSDTAALLEHGSTVGATLFMAIELEDPSAILDKEIQDDAGSAHIPTSGLETSEFQDHVLAKLLDLRRLKASIESTKDRAELDHDSAKDLRDYCLGSNDTPGTDADERAKLEKVGYSAAELDAEDETLVYARNRDWIPKLEQLFAQGDVFVVVGADHLIGDKGVIKQLEARGFTAKRIVR